MFSNRNIEINSNVNGCMGKETEERSWMKKVPGLSPFGAGEDMTLLCCSFTELLAALETNQ